MEKVRCHNLWVPASDAKVFSRYAEFEGLPDLDVSKLSKCISLCPERKRALDVGAHVGATAIYLARHFESVLAFEAVPDTYRFLELNVAEIANVDARPVAVGAEAGKVYFKHYSKHGQLSHVSPGGDDDQGVGPIPVITIDSLALDDVSFMKIDVEGFELAVIEGAKATIQRCRPMILMEQAGNEEKHFGRPRDEASAWLESLGMTQHPDAPPRMMKDRLYWFAPAA